MDALLTCSGVSEKIPHEVVDRFSRLLAALESAHDNAEALKNDSSLPAVWRIWATAISAEVSELRAGTRQRETIESWRQHGVLSQPEPAQIAQ